MRAPDERRHPPRPPQAALDNDPALIGELPYAPGFLATAPDPVREHLYAALGIECVYRPATKQVTIRATITSSTPGIIAALLADPRTSGDNASVSAGEAPGLLTNRTLQVWQPFLSP